MTASEMVVAAVALSGAIAGLLGGFGGLLIARNTVRSTIRKEKLDERRDKFDEYDRIVAAQSKRMDAQDVEICKQADQINELKTEVHRYQNWAAALVRQVSALGKRPISIDEANGGAPGATPQRRGFDI